MINYENFSILTALLIGLAGNIHCIGMCSSIITIFSISLSKDKQKYLHFYNLYYNLGRLIGYVLINLTAFTLGLILIKTLKIENLSFLKLLSGLTLLIISFYLLNIVNLIKSIEKLGFGIWNHINTYSKLFFPIKNPFQGIILGIIWSHIPCGLVYSTIIWSTSSGSMFKSIILISFFWVGTLPSMFGLGLFPTKIKKIINYKRTKFLLGLTFLIFGTYNIYLYFVIQNCH